MSSPVKSGDGVAVRQASPDSCNTAPSTAAIPVSRSAWWLLAAGGLLLTIAYVVIPYGRVASSIYVLTTLLAAIGVVVAVCRRPRPFCPSAWLLIALALAFAAIGHGIWYWLDLRGLEPFPSWADAFYLLVYPLFIAALWMLGRESGGGDHARSDALIVGVSAGVLGWAVLVAPYLQDPDLTLFQLIVSAAYPVADLIVLPLILRFVFLHRTRIRAHLFLLLGMLAYLAADMLYAHGNSSGWYAPGGLTDGLWLVAYSLFIAAVWHPSSRLEPRSRASRAELSLRRIVVVGGAALMTPAVILFAVGSDGDIVRVAAIGSIVLFLLIMFRMAGLIREVHRQAEVLELTSRMDPLTGASNRRHLKEELEREMERARRGHTPLTLAFVDLDHFKRFNDTFGHSAGDALLRELATSWRQALRPADVLARFGGEEFVVVFPDTGLDESRAAIERLRATVPQGQTCSVGITAMRENDTADGLIGRADQALYRAKHSGRDRIELDGPDASVAHKR